MSGSGTPFPVLTSAPSTASSSACKDPVPTNERAWCRIDQRHTHVGPVMSGPTWVLGHLAAPLCHVRLRTRGRGRRSGRGCAAIGQVEFCNIILHYISQPLWYAPGQLVLGEPQRRQVGQAAQFRRNLTRQLVDAETQRRQVGQAAQLRRNLARQLVLASHSTVRLDRPPSSGGISPVNWLSARPRILRLDRRPNSGGISPVNWLDLERQAFQVGEAAQLRRISPVNWLDWRDKPSRLVRPPSSGGISPVNWLDWRDKPSGW